MNNLNLWAIFVAGMASMLIGMWYYSSAGLGKHWLKLISISKKKMDQERKKNMGKTMIVAFLAQILIALVLSIFANLFSHDIIGGLLVGVLSWAGFALTTSVNDVLWEGKKSALWVLHNAYRLIAFVVMGIIVSVWV